MTRPDVWVIVCNRGVCVLCELTKTMMLLCHTTGISHRNKKNTAPESLRAVKIFSYKHVGVFLEAVFRSNVCIRIWRENEWERNVTNPKCLQSVSRVNNCYSGKFWVHFMISQFPHWGIGEFYMLCVWYSFLNVWFLSSPWMWADLCSRSWECVWVRVYV